MEPDALIRAKAARARKFFRVRVAVLLGVLTFVLLLAWRDVRSRRARNNWDHTLEVAVVVLRLAPTDEAALAALRVRTAALETRLADELRRYRPDAPKPFAFSFFGPVDVDARMPVPEGDGVLDLAKQSWASWRYLSAIDSASGVDARTFDTRIYVVVRPPTSAERQMVEGQSEQDGRVGTVEVELDVQSADFALLVVAHELFHTLGATDKYDAQGKTMVPLGFAEPDRRPLYPQRFVEIMARNRPIAANAERVPESLDELAVGPTTAREIAWMR